MRTPNSRKKRTIASKTKAARVTRQPTVDEIQMHAYAIYVRRGSEHGHDLDDWLQAERELVAASPGQRAKKFSS